MPRKPTPSVLGENQTPVPEDEIMNVLAENPLLDIQENKPAGAEKKVTRKKTAAAETKTPSGESAPPIEAVSPKTLGDAVTDAITETGEAIAVEMAQAVGEATVATDSETTAPEITPEQPVPTPSPLYKPMRLLVLASLGVVSYAIEEGIYIINKLVERGELTQKEGMKLISEMTSKSKLPIPSMLMKRVRPVTAEEKKGEPVAEPTSGGEANLEISADNPTSEPEQTAVEDEWEGKAPKVVNTNVVTLNVLSFGSPVEIDPRLKRDKPK